MIMNVVKKAGVLVAGAALCGVGSTVASAATPAAAAQNATVHSGTTAAPRATVGSPREGDVSERFIIDNTTNKDLVLTYQGCDVNPAALCAWNSSSHTAPPPPVTILSQGQISAHVIWYPFNDSVGTVHLQNADGTPGSIDFKLKVDGAANPSTWFGDTPRVNLSAWFSTVRNPGQWPIDVIDIVSTAGS